METEIKEVAEQEQVQDQESSSQQPQPQPTNPDLVIGEIKKYVDVKINELLDKFSSADKVETKKEEENVEW